MRDFATSDVSVLTLVSAHVGRPQPVFDEVEQIDHALASSLGLKLVEPTLEMLVEAAAARGRLSFPVGSVSSWRRAAASRLSSVVCRWLRGAFAGPFLLRAPMHRPASKQDAPRS